MWLGSEDPGVLDVSQRGAAHGVRGVKLAQHAPQRRLIVRVLAIKASCLGGICVNVHQHVCRRANNYHVRVIQQRKTIPRRLAVHSARGALGVALKAVDAKSGALLRGGDGGVGGAGRHDGRGPQGDARHHDDRDHHCQPRRPCIRRIDTPCAQRATSLPRCAAHLFRELKTVLGPNLLRILYLG